MPPRSIQLTPAVSSDIITRLGPGFHLLQGFFTCEFCINLNADLLGNFLKHDLGNGDIVVCQQYFEFAIPQ